MHLPAPEPELVHAPRRPWSLYHDRMLSKLAKASDSSVGAPVPGCSGGCVGGGGGLSEGGVLIMSWKLSSVAGSFGM